MNHFIRVTIIFGTNDDHLTIIRSYTFNKIYIDHFILSSLSLQYSSIKWTKPSLDSILLSYDQNVLYVRVVTVKNCFDLLANEKGYVNSREIN